MREIGRMGDGSVRGDKGRARRQHRGKRREPPRDQARIRQFADADRRGVQQFDDGEVPGRDRLAETTSIRKQSYGERGTRSRKLEGAWWKEGAYIVASFARMADGSAAEHDGQVWRIAPDGASITLYSVFGRNPDPAVDLAAGGHFDGPDNITVSPHGGVVISEINYHAVSDLDTDDFLELTNTSASPIDMSGWSFSAGITAVLPSGTTIAPGQRFVLSPSAASFSALHGFAPDAIYTGKLSNSGEAVTLVDTALAVVDMVKGIDKSVEIAHVRLVAKSGGRSGDWHRED